MSINSPKVTDMHKQVARSLCPPVLWTLLSNSKKWLLKCLLPSPSRDGEDMITAYVNGMPLKMPRTHNLPGLLTGYPHYEGEIDRLAEFLVEKTSELCVVDIGANVGDTVAMISARDTANFLCVEAHPQFFSLLSDNLQNTGNVVCVKAVVSDTDGGVVDASMTEAGGTAHIADTAVLQVAGEHSLGEVASRSVDGLVAELPRFSHANLLKIDTDGFDYKVLLGAEQLLREARPAIHIELSFRHWKEFGHATASEAARYLADAGYGECLIYDNLGYVFGRDTLHTPRHLHALESYAFRRKFFYVNLIAFHDSFEHRHEFFDRELSRPFDHSFSG